MKIFLLKTIDILFIVLILNSCTINVSFEDDAKQNGHPTYDCDLSSIRLKADMPHVPKVPKDITSDAAVGEYMVKHIEELRTYIKEKDEEIEKLSKACK